MSSNKKVTSLCSIDFRNFDKQINYVNELAEKRYCGFGLRVGRVYLIIIKNYAKSSNPP